MIAGLKEAGLWCPVFPSSRPEASIDGAALTCRMMGMYPDGPGI